MRNPENVKATALNAKVLAERLRLARQTLAAKLNVWNAAINAGNCAEEIATADAELVAHGYTGPGTYNLGHLEHRTAVLVLKDSLDAWNNNENADCVYLNE